VFEACDCEEQTGSGIEVRSKEAHNIPCIGRPHERRKWSCVGVSSLTLIVWVVVVDLLSRGRGKASNTSGVVGGNERS
jgi:hypothetical protein